MDINVARRNARALLNELGLKHYRLVFDRRASRRLGQTRYAAQEIGLTYKWVVIAPWDEVRQVVLHEGAHALVGPGHGHDRVWKAQARAIGAPARYSFATTASVPGNILVICKKCGVVGTMHRMPKRPYGKCHSVCRYPVTFERKVGR